MRSASWFPVLALFGLLGLSGCGGQPDALSPSFATGTCTLTFTHIGGKTLTVQANSVNNDAGWFIKNTGAVSATITGQTVSKSGNVTAVRPINWATFPYTLAVGGQIDADLFFDAGAPGTGNVGMTISTSWGSKVLPNHPVVIQATATGIPFGVWGLSFTPLTPGPWTAGVKSSNSHSDFINQLDAARANHIKGLWFGMAGSQSGFTTYRTSTDSIFDMAKWKAKIDAGHGGTIRPDGTSGYYLDEYLSYIQDSTLLGIVILDDITHWTDSVRFADLEEMARFAKMRFPALTTAVRERATELEKRAPLCSSCTGGHSPYAKLDAGWAQYRSDRGLAATYRDQNITSATNMKLGLLLGINITDGNRFKDPDGVTRGHNVTDAQLLSWGTEFLKTGAAYSDYVCGFFMWDVTYPTLTGATMNTLAGKAASHVRSPCKRRP